MSTYAIFYLEKSKIFHRCDSYLSWSLQSIYFLQVLSKMLNKPYHIISAHYSYDCSGTNCNTYFCASAALHRLHFFLIGPPDDLAWEICKTSVSMQPCAIWRYRKLMSHRLCVNNWGSAMSDVRSIRNFGGEPYSFTKIPTVPYIST